MYDLRAKAAILALGLATALCVCAGCLRSSSQEVVVYAALDREFSDPILRDFEARSGVTVLAKYDVESTKTVGLATALMQERNRPRCDVFWNNEILHTLRLERMGLLDSYDLPNAASFPPNYRSADGRWYGFAARARVFLVNRDLLSEDKWPASVVELADPKWQGRCGLAKPLFGTTATHAAVLFAHWGRQRAQEFFAAVRDNAQVLAGNKQVAVAVGRGQLEFGITDTDDAIIEIEKGMPVAIVYPDQTAGQMGTLFIPNTLCILQGAPHPDNARRLLDYLLTSEIETRLAQGASAQFPLHSGVAAKPRVCQQEVRWMDVDFAAAADAWDEAADFLRQQFAAAD